MDKKASGPGFMRAAPTDHYEFRGLGHQLAYENSVPELRDLDQAQRAKLARKARPGETWEQLIERLQRDGVLTVTHTAIDASDNQ
ncbi:hypothetical protein [Pseudomonas sp.]|jgi:hypothetical protein|uniref:hypothetical protein n=1 Tax=Pseudomonas sp. TaxID=306 RepID=UPI002ED7ECFE